MTCDGCGAILTDDNAAPTCSQHPLCTRCYDPLHAMCRGCLTVAAELARDVEDDRRADVGRDERNVR